MQSKIKNRQGFTIIEVMIVLAIAGLIMLIVFLAVPALQRSSRNTSRKNDASRLASAVSTFVSNSNGLLPCESSGTFKTTPNDASIVYNDAGSLGQLSFTGESCATAPSAKNFVITASAPGSQPTSWNDNEVVVYLGSTCQGSWAVPGSARQAALIYPVEGGKGYQTSCISAL